MIHFLLSNCRYWRDEFHLDGFRFDGVTSMLYTDHGLDKTFTTYDDYFNDQVDNDALTCLTLANKLIHKLKPDALTIAEDMYHNMHLDHNNISVERGVALHKMIRLITLAIGGEGYLNFMGNEFGHPEWIDFPREGNDWSFQYARRQWSLRDDPNLIYYHLAEFDKEMIKIADTFNLLDPDDRGDLICNHILDKLICFQRAQLIFIFNFNPR